MNQIERCLAQGPAVNGRPQINHVSLLSAFLVKALKDILVQVDAEGPAPSVTTMQRTGAPLLGTPPPQPGQQAQLVEQTGYRKLFFKMAEVNVRPAPLSPSSAMLAVPVVLTTVRSDGASVGWLSAWSFGDKSLSLLGLFADNSLSFSSTCAGTCQG